MIVLTTRLNVMINALMHNMMMIPYLVSLYAMSTHVSTANIAISIVGNEAS